jgi:beta-RFAP synthase
MIEFPHVKLSVVASDRFEVEGPGKERVEEFARRWAAWRGDAFPPPCRMVIESLPRMHAGLGVGSQLGLSVARALNEFVGDRSSSPETLARSVGRGERSAVGTYGFFYGGLIAEFGKSADDQLAPLEVRLDLPPSWRWLMVCPTDQGGLHGTQEQSAFADMRDPASDFASQLLEEVQKRLLPAARQGSFADFSASLYRFGYYSGLSFASVQGGAYNGPRLSQIVESIRQLGIEGVGQSSWGPTIFALCPDEAAAQTLARQLRVTMNDCDVSITATCNHGARIGWN